LWRGRPSLGFDDWREAIGIFEVAESELEIGQQNLDRVKRVRNCHPKRDIWSQQIESRGRKEKGIEDLGGGFQCISP
jgi:hypothetical protein